jgi:hypothetical protein
MIDETTSPPLHRWRSFARLFMFFHPRVGAELYAVALGDSAYREGWNVIHPSKGSNRGLRYMRVSRGGGLHTYDKPDVPDEQMNHVYEDNAPQLNQTRAWSKMLELGELLVKRNQIPAKMVQTTQRNIDVTSQSPLRNDRAKIESAAADAMRHFQAVLAQRRASVADVFAQTIHQVLAYMNFECDGTQAANTLSWILAALSTKFPSPLDSSTDSDRVLFSADHLRDLTFDLLGERGNKSLTSYCEMTYLALLYGNTSILLYDRLLASNTVGPEDRETLEWQRFAVDEKLAHEAAPSLVNPMWYCPAGLAESMVASPTGEKFALYPGAVEPWKRREIDPAQRWQAVVEFSALAGSTEIAETLDGSNCPVSPLLKKHLTGFLLARDSGRQA